MSSLKEVNAFPGRFQPFHLGHLKACEDAFNENGLPTVVMYMHNETFDSRKPFPDEIIEKELNALKARNRFIKDVIWLKNPMPMRICRILQENGYIAKLWLAGEDRMSSYQRLMDATKIKNELKLPYVPEFFKTARRGSATEVRAALREDDEDAFRKLMPKETWKLYGDFREQIMSIKESSMMGIREYSNYINETEE